MKTIIKQDKKIRIIVTYTNTPSSEAIQRYAYKLKKIIDSKVIAS